MTKLSILGFVSTSDFLSLSRLQSSVPTLIGSSVRIFKELYKNTWLRGQDLNLRPSGYEPDELPDCSTPRYYVVYDMFSFSKIFLKKKMDGGGFEPPKQIAADLQSVPFGHSGIHPYGIVFHKADDRTRTDNLLITNQLLCQLSHIGVFITADL